MQYEALEACQNKYNKDDDACKNLIFSAVYISGPVGSWDPWIHGVIIEPSGVTTGSLYTIQMKKMGDPSCIIQSTYSPQNSAYGKNN